jgi:hypothetical protein
MVMSPFQASAANECYYKNPIVILTVKRLQIAHESESEDAWHSSALLITLGRFVRHRQY